LRLPPGIWKPEDRWEADGFGRHVPDYSLFWALFEAQRLGEVLPFIRAHRPKLPHPVYEIRDYRMRRAANFLTAGTGSEFSG
jgi:hypothetical protein